MEAKTIFYLTTNAIWGGSEILWTASAQKLIEEGRNIRAGSYYGFSLLKNHLQEEQRFIDLNNRYYLPLLSKVLRKFRLGRHPSKDRLHKLVIEQMPDLVIISQGNNVDGLSLMQFCYDHRIPFVTLTHLVTESLWPSLDDEKIRRLSFLYAQSKMNFFVSRYTLTLHQKMLGNNNLNSRITYNPFTKSTRVEIKYPPVRDGWYKVALIGRLENFHKGYDFLIDILKQEKWKQRTIAFSVYGRGPHGNLLKRLIEQNGIKNLFIREHVENVAEIWEDHHILLMPSRMEGQSLSLIESMWFKRAAIVTLVGGVEELVEDGHSGFIAAFPTAKHIDEAMERAWENRERWEEMGNAAFELIKERHPEDAVLYFNEQIKKIADS